MEIQEMIRKLELLKAEIEWDFSLEYQVTLEQAIFILREIENGRQGTPMD